VQTSTSASRPVQSEVQRVTPPPVAPSRSSDLERFGSSGDTPSSTIPAWAKFGIPAAIIVIAVVVYLLVGSNPKKRQADNNNQRKGDTPIAEPVTGQETTNRAALGNVELTGTAPCHRLASHSSRLPIRQRGSSSPSVTENPRISGPSTGSSPTVTFTRPMRFRTPKPPAVTVSK
jgi:hypothetical protein